MRLELSNFVGVAGAFLFVVGFGVGGLELLVRFGAAYGTLAAAGLLILIGAGVIALALFIGTFKRGRDK